MQGASPPVPSPGTGPRQPTPQRPMADPTRPPSRGGVQQVGVQPHRVMGCLRQDALTCEEVLGVLAEAGRGQDDVRVTYVRREGDAQPGQHVIGRLVSVRLVQLVQVDHLDAQPVQDEDILLATGLYQRCGVARPAVPVPVQERSPGLRDPGEARHDGGGSTRAREDPPGAQDRVVEVGGHHEQVEVAVPRASTGCCPHAIMVGPRRPLTRAFPRRRRSPRRAARGSRASPATGRGARRWPAVRPLARWCAAPPVG